MKHTIILCDNRLQDEWAEQYLSMAQILTQKFGIEGRAIVREGVRRYADALAQSRKKEILETGNVTNLETVFTCGFGFPCGERTSKEWIECSAEQFFINIITCPYHNYWANRGALDLGIMFCEEYYPILVHGSTSQRAQINLGNTLMNGRDDFCRLSCYLRPANLTPPERAECFSAHRLSGDKPKNIPPYVPDYTKFKELLYDAFCQAAGILQGDLGRAVLQQIVREK